MKDIHFREIDSTSAYLKREWGNLPSFCFVSASYQTNGKGRMERQWLSKENENLLFSILLKEKGMEEYFKSLSIGVACSLACFLENRGFKGVSVKWPNDVYINSKKVCGILLEGSLPDYLVLGIGINVNQKEFNGDYRTIPTSLALESNGIIDIDELKDSLFKTLTKSIKEILKGDKSYKEIYGRLDYLLGKKRSFNLNGKNIEGLVKGIDENDALILDCNGEILHISSGEIN